MVVLKELECLAGCVRDGVCLAGSGKILWADEKKLATCGACKEEKKIALSQWKI